MSAAADGAGLRAAFVAARQSEGASDVRFHLRQAEVGNELLADNPNEHLRSRLGAGGVTVSADDGAFEVTLRTATIGCGDHASPMARAVAPERSADAANRAEYARTAGSADVTEWWVNGPLGVEQGYTIETSPCAVGANELEIAVEVSGLEPVIQPGTPGVVELQASGTRRANITDLYAADAAGRSLPSAFEVRGKQLVYRVGIAGAAWPIQVDPVLTGLQATLTPNVSTSNFGRHVAVSGTTAIVGSWVESAAYVFVRTGNTWSLQQKLTGASGARFGWDVAISGNSVIVGEP